MLLLLLGSDGPLPGLEPGLPVPIRVCSRACCHGPCSTAPGRGYLRLVLAAGTCGLLLGRACPGLNRAAFFGRAHANVTPLFAHRFHRRGPARFHRACSRFRRHGPLHHSGVGMTGFEPATPSSRTRCATKLRHIPLAAHGIAMPAAAGNPQLHLPFSR